MPQNRQRKSGGKVRLGRLGILSLAQQAPRRLVCRLPALVASFSFWAFALATQWNGTRVGAKKVEANEPTQLVLASGEGREVRVSDTEPAGSVGMLPAAVAHFATGIHQHESRCTLTSCVRRTANVVVVLRTTVVP